MEKRVYAKTGEKVSLLGYGTMRLPADAENNAAIREDEALELIDIAYKNGVNYFDTAYMYHGGNSERTVGHALSRYPRESFFLADKLPGWVVKDGGAKRAKEVFEEQLSKCRVNYFDFYLCHALNDDLAFFKNVFLDQGVLAYLESEQQAGRIRKLGFSFHGNPDSFRYLMELRHWDFCQIQCNYFDWDFQQAKELYRLAEESGVQLVIMEPVRGGALAKLCEESVSILKQAEPEKSTASWAIRFVASLPNVLCVLSGMSDRAQVLDNLATVSDFRPLTEADRNVLRDALAAYQKKQTVPCTACRYCAVCPKEIAIPEIFGVYNQAAETGMMPGSVGISAEESRSRAAAFLAAYEAIPEEKRAEHCVRCGKCAEHCPQSIRIPDRLRDIAAIAGNCRKTLG